MPELWERLQALRAKGHLSCDPEYLKAQTLPRDWIEAVKGSIESGRPQLPQIKDVTQFRDVFGIAGQYLFIDRDAPFRDKVLVADLNDIDLKARLGT
jgi:hypothetical protein